MKPYAAPALLALLLAATASANVVRIPVARNSPGSTVSRRHHPRLSPRASFTESLVNNITGGGYYASVSVGTPGQDIDMILDTGSSDAFIVAAGADLCESPRLQQLYQTECGQTFDSTRSSTFEVVVPDGFQIQYLDGSTASGDYVTDHFEIGDTVIESLQMGLANQTASGIGVLGIGYTANEAAETLYPNLVDQMVAQDFIPTKAYSLYLNDYQSSTGSILFGGVDTEKFIGGLTVVPVLPDAQTQSFTSFTVGLTAVSYAFPNGTTGDASLQGGSLDAVLDSGTTLSYFPDSVATPLFEALGAFTYSSMGSVGLTLVECSLATSGLELTFRFNDSVSIVVPADEVVIDAIGGVVPPEIPLEQPCLFGIQNSGDSLPSEGARQIDFALLGDTFLRSAYVVYDLDNNEIALAQANLNSTDTNVQELTESSDLASFEGVERQESSSGTSGGGGGSGGSSGTGSSDSGGSSGTSFVSGVASRSGFISASATSVASTTLRDTIRGPSASTVSMEGVATPTVTTTSATLGSTADSSPSGRPSPLTSVSKTLLSSSYGVQSVSATFTNGVIASSAASAGLFVANSEHGALYKAGLAALFAMSVSTLFWL